MKRSLEKPDVESPSKRVQGSTGQNGSGQSAQGRPSQQEDACARWCVIQPDGAFSVDETKIKCFLSNEKRKDKILMPRIIRGLELTSEIYPLIFDEQEAPSTPDSVRFRSLAFFRDLAANPTTITTRIKALKSEQRQIFVIGVRDFFIADYHALLGEHEKALLRELVKMIDFPLDPVNMNGITLSYHPTAEFTIVKFIEDLGSKLKDQCTEYFVPCLTIPNLSAVFVRPADLSYHNFENIIHLDAWFEAGMAQKRDENLSPLFSGLRQVSTEHQIYTCKLQGNTTMELLNNLTSLDLFVPPLNKETRGGDRFIFHSSILSKALTNTIRSSGFFDTSANRELSSSFEFVNYVFRYNRFAPGDSKFESHLDTPYYDCSRSHVSKYTLLIYLTGGHNDPALRINDISFNNVEEMTCIIFNQRYQHEGRPYLDGYKAFLRTELIFRDTNLQHDPTIGQIFSEACYMTSQGVIDRDSSLSLHAHKCFERANSLHWSLEDTTTHRSVYLWKQFQGINFVTNGYNYWFEENIDVDVKDYAFLAILDYLNCKVGDQSFCSCCTSNKIEEQISNNNQIWSFLSSHKGGKSAKGFGRLTEHTIESLLNKGPSKPFEGRLDEWEGEEDEIGEFEEDGDGCCPMHSFPMFNPRKSNEVMECHELCRSYSRKQLLSAPLILLDKQVIINEANIKIVGDKVFVLRDSQQTPLPPINFAACWSDETSPPEFVVVGSEILAPDLLLPPVSFRECKEGYQLSLDFFRNDWMVRVDGKRTIPVPDVSEKPEDEIPFSEKIPENTNGMEKILDYFE